MRRNGDALKRSHVFASSNWLNYGVFRHLFVCISFVKSFFADRVDTKRRRKLYSATDDDAARERRVAKTVLSRISGANHLPKMQDAFVRAKARIRLLFDNFI